MKNVLSLAVVSAMVFGFAGTAAAQGTSTTITPTFELSAGYQFLRTGEVCTDDSVLQVCSPPEQNFPFGVVVDAARNFGRFAIAGEIGWSYKSDEQSFTVGDTVVNEDLTFNTWHLGAGPRYNFGGDQFRPFVQVLLGMIQDRISSDINDDVSNTSFMLQPGVGGTWVLGDGWGVVGQVDYRRVFLGDEEVDVDDDDLDLDLSTGRNDFRLFIGIRMILD
jgi:hypothetical protein